MTALYAGLISVKKMAASSRCGERLWLFFTIRDDGSVSGGKHSLSDIPHLSANKE